MILEDHKIETHSRL